MKSHDCHVFMQRLLPSLHHKRIKCAIFVTLALSTKKIHG
ncbi:unnamed protein product [Brassica rapa subsp. narinosa]